MKEQMQNLIRKTPDLSGEEKELYEPTDACPDCGNQHLSYTNGCVSCPECGIVAREVPWAAHGSRFSYAFEDTCCWCALSMSKVACQNPRARAGPWHDRPGTQWGADGPRRASMRRGRRPRWQAAGRPKGFFSSQEKRPCECTGRNRSLVLLGYGPCALSLDSVRRMVASSPQTTDWRGLGDSAVVMR